ncbi:hypothetical protein E3E26_06320 [Thermococcus sp. LS1]|nr:hypothetical protein [Thermococcus sp. LS1]
MKMSMKTLLVLFIGALIPLSTAAWAASVNATETTNVTAPANGTLLVNATNMTNVTNTTNTSLQTAAYNLLIIVDNVANYTANMIADLNVSNVTLPNWTLEAYYQAETMRKEAWDLYYAGNYEGSINASMSALELYKEAVEELMDYYTDHQEHQIEEQYEYYELIMEAKEELNRAAEYFPYVEKVIKEAQAEGLNVTAVVELYNQTKEAYLVVAQDIANTDGNITKLENDLDYAEELMDKLEDAVEELTEQIVDAKAEEISYAFMEKLQEQMKLMQELMAMLQNSTIINATYLAEDFAELQMMYEQFTQLVESGQYEEALDMLHDINEELKDIVDETKEIEKEMHEEKEYDDEYEDDESHDDQNEDYKADDQSGDYEEHDDHESDDGQYNDSDEGSSSDDYEDEDYSDEEDE